MSIQVNVRLEKQLLGDIDLLAKVLRISRTEWLRTTIARAVKDETLNLREAIILEFARGNVSKTELRKIFGSEAKDIEYITYITKKGKKEIDALVKQGKL
jgi:predicted transcriptional regulator